MAEEELKVLAFADDVAFILGNETSIGLCLEKTDMFARYSGVEMNQQKSVVAWLGIQ